jgi:hypothetical protein
MAWSIRVALALSFTLLVTACSGGAATNQPCQLNDECESGRCGAFFDGAEGNVCLETCTADADCPDGLACGTRADGERLCAAACDPDFFDSTGFVCVDHAPVACELAGAARDCYTCGCGAGEFCDGLWRELGDPGQCQPLNTVGGPCRVAEECASGNCSVLLALDPEPPGECWVAAGDACTDDTCGSCEPTAQGEVCAQLCGSALDCDGDELCARPGGATDYYCRTLCEQGADCPRGWTCDALADSNDRVCFPPITCELGTEGACWNCTDLPNADYDICAEACTPGISVCPLSWSCTQITSGDWRCLPPG